MSEISQFRARASDSSVNRTPSRPRPNLRAFAWAMQQKPADGQQKAILAFLAAHADDHGYVTMTVERLAEIARYRTSIIVRALNALVESRLLHCTPEADGYRLPFGWRNAR